MEDQVLKIKSLVDSTEHYVRTSVELYKLKAIDKAADGVAKLFSRIIIIPFVVLFFIMLNIATALWIGEALGKTSFGFFILGGFYGLIGLALYLFGNLLAKAPIKNSIIRYALNIELPWKSRKPQVS